MPNSKGLGCTLPRCPGGLTSLAEALWPYKGNDLQMNSTLFCLIPTLKKSASGIEGGFSCTACQIGVDHWLCHIMSTSVPFRQQYWKSNIFWRHAVTKCQHHSSGLDPNPRFHTFQTHRGLIISQICCHLNRKFPTWSLLQTKAKLLSTL